MREDNVSARRVDPSPKTNSTSVGMMAESPALPRKDDVLVENGDASPKPCLQFLGMRSPSAAGGLLPAGEAFTAARTTFNKTPLCFFSTEEMYSKTNWRTRILYVSYDSNFLPAACSFRMVIDTISGENRMFDPGGSQGRLRACPFLESWRVLLCSGYSCWSSWMRLQRCFEGSTLRDSTPYVSVNRWFFAARPV